MYTRCPQCKAVHTLSAGNLAQARGLVQCGPCGRTFSALSFLFDEWPEGEPCRPDNGPGTTLPVLEPAPVADAAADVSAPVADVSAPVADVSAPVADVAADVSAPEEDAVTDDSAPDAEQPGQASETDPFEPLPADDRRLVWLAATVLLALATVANAAWTFREPLLNNPRISAWFNRSGEARVDEHGLLRDPGQIQLVSRDMHTHPTRSGILVLSLTFVNLASRSQEYPQLEVTLTDASNQPVARRRLQPQEYLRPGADIEAGLAADVYLPVLLELGDPGEQAVGFEIQFL